jgi:hypothetical protein
MDRHRQIATRFPFALTVLAVLAVGGWAQAQGNTPDDVDDEISVLIGDLSSPNQDHLAVCSKLAYEAKYRGRAKRVIPVLVKIVEAGPGTYPGYRSDAEYDRLMKLGRNSFLSLTALDALRANGFDAKTAVQPLITALRKALQDLDYHFKLQNDVPFPQPIKTEEGVFSRQREYPNPGNSPTCRWANKFIADVSKLLGSAGAEANAAVPVLLNVVRGHVPQPTVREQLGADADAADDDVKAAAEAVAAAEPWARAVVTPPARKAAIDALGAIGSEKALEPLLRVRVHETDPTTKEALSRAIAAIRKAQSGRPKAAAPASDGGDTVKPTGAPGSKPAEEGQSKPSQPVIKAHLRDLGDADPQVRREAAEALGELGPTARGAAATALRKALRDKNEAVRDAAAKALEQIFADSNR